VKKSNSGPKKRPGPRKKEKKIRSRCQLLGVNENCKNQLLKVGRNRARFFWKQTYEREKKYKTRGKKTWKIAPTMGEFFKHGPGGRRSNGKTNTKKKEPWGVTKKKKGGRGGGRNTLVPTVKDLLDNKRCKTDVEEGSKGF